jgi:hypothetical protein
MAALVEDLEGNFQPCRRSLRPGEWFNAECHRVRPVDMMIAGVLSVSGGWTERASGRDVRRASSGHGATGSGGADEIPKS